MGRPRRRDNIARQIDFRGLGPDVEAGERGRPALAGLQPLQHVIVARRAGRVTGRALAASWSSTPRQLLSPFSLIMPLSPQPPANSSPFSPTNRQPILGTLPLMALTPCVTSSGGYLLAVHPPDRDRRQVAAGRELEAETPAGDVGLLDRLQDLGLDAGRVVQLQARTGR